MEKNSADHIWTLIARKLSGEASVEELHELNEILREDPMTGYSKEILQDLWAGSPDHDSPYAENRYKELVQQIKNMGIDDGRFALDDHYINSDSEVQAKTNTKKWLIGLSSFLLLLAVAGILYYNSGAGNLSKGISEQLVKNEINTKNGSKTSLILPDGTKVWLNSKSQLTYEKTYGNKLREVTLTGEAFFDVVKNAEKPFIIHTNKMDVKVLGTAFNVKCYPGEKTTETSLLRGSIEITLKDRKEKIMMKPNEKLVINNLDYFPARSKGMTIKKNIAAAAIEKSIISLEHLTFFPSDSTVIETAWVQNKLLFSSESFEEVALKMERWYNVNIEFTDDRIKAEPLTGNFEKETVEEALEALRFTTQFAYSIKNNTITIAKSTMPKKTSLR